MGTEPDLLIIGGGIIGLTTALVMGDAGLRVEVLDQGEPGREASWAGAGIIPPGNPDHAAEGIDRLRADSTARFAEFSRQLRERTGLDNGYHRCGGLEFLHHHELDLTESWIAEGVTFEPIDAHRLMEIDPGVAWQPGMHAFYFPEYAQVRNPWHLKAIRAACQQAGVTITPHTAVQNFEVVGTRIAVVTTRSGERRQAGQFLVASGAWSQQLLAPLGFTSGVAPVRGQIVLFKPAEPVMKRVTIVEKRYLVPRQDGRVLVGSTEEPEVGFEKGNTPSAIAALTEFACQVVPALRSTPIETTWSGLRPGSKDGLPTIGIFPGIENLLLAIGHYRAGVQLSLGTAEIIRRLIQKVDLAFPIAAFAPGRDPDLTVRPTFRS